MTENEAIKILTLNNDMKKKLPNLQEVYKVAVKALEEIQQYRNLGTIEFLTDMKSNYVEVLSDLRQYQKIGTVEECREAREMTRRYCEPKYLGENTAIGCRNGECRCGNIVKSYQKFCDECGIELDWGNVTAWQQLPEPYKEGE